MVIAQAVVLALGLVSGVVLARLLGPRDRGIYAVATLAPQILASLAGSGLADALTHWVSRDPANRAVYLREGQAIWLRVVILAGVLIVGLWFLGSSSIFSGVSGSLYATAAIAIPFWISAFALQGYMFATEPAWCSQVSLVGERVVFTVAVAVIALLGGGLVDVVWATVAGAAVGAALGVGVLLWRQGGPGRSRRGRMQRQALMSYATRVSTANLAQKMTYRLDQLIMNALAGASAVGVYSIAARTAEMPLIISRALRQTWFQAQSAEASSTRRHEATVQSFRRLLALNLLIIPAFAGVGAVLIPVVYGSAFSDAVQPFVVLCAATLLLSMSFAWASGLTGAGRPGALTTATWLGVVTTVSLDLALIPSLDTLGAAIASTISYGAFTCFVVWQWMRVTGDRLALRELRITRGDARAILGHLKSFRSR